MQLLPTPNDGYPHQTAQVQLGDTFVVTWRWNARDGVWYFGLTDVDSVPIVSGVRVVLNVDLLGGVSDSRRPDGPVVVVDSAGRADEPGLLDLGKRVKVVFIPRAELSS
jgi:hypothetical protein